MMKLFIIIVTKNTAQNWGSNTITHAALNTINNTILSLEVCVVTLLDWTPKFVQCMTKPVVEKRLIYI